MKKTPLYDRHVSLGGRIVEFGGWMMPVQYTGLSHEHQSVRTKAGLFDVSHMGEVHVEGPDAEAFLNHLVTNNVSRLITGGAQYTVMCKESGGIVDDLLVYKRGENRYLLCINAGNIDSDYEWIKQQSQKFSNLKISNQSEAYCQIALQGPKSVAILSKLTTLPIADIKYYHFIEGDFLGAATIISRTGYTGEDGFELYAPANMATQIWDALLDAGKDFDLVPCGLGARDTLRLEAKFPLYGHELSLDINPLEAGLAWVVKLDKANFVGKEALLKIKEKGMHRALVGLKVLDKGIPRQGYELFTADGAKRIGIVTSGTMSPSLGYPVAIAYIDLPHNSIGTKVAAKVRDRLYNAEIVSTPFYKKA
jgi:aminomethyltransferase